MKKDLLMAVAVSVCLRLTLQAQISVGTGGTGVISFDSLPPASSWSTRSAGQVETDITEAAEMDQVVQTNTASITTNALGSTTSLSPMPSRNAQARWNSAGRFLQTRPTANACTLLMARLLNDTGSTLAAVDVSYDFNALVSADSQIYESIYGLRAYWSLTGEADSWHEIAELCTGTPGSLWATLDLGTWLAGGYLYILWADDNGPASDTAPQKEGAYTIDNFSATPTGLTPLSVTIAPGNTNVIQCSTIAFEANVQGGVAPYQYQWYLNSAESPVTGATGSVLAITNVQRLNMGSYFVRVSDSTAGGVQTAESSPSILQVTEDTSGLHMVGALSSTNLHTVTVRFSKAVTLSGSSGEDFVLRPTGGSGDILFNSSRVTDDTDVILTTTEPIQPKNYSVVVRGNGVMGCAATAADGSFVRLAQERVLLGMADDTLWRYRDDGVDLGTDWVGTNYDASGWPENYAVFDAKRGSNRVYITDASTPGLAVPVRTRIHLTSTNFQDNAADIPTFYFRAKFNFPGEIEQSELKVATFFDDGGVIFLNGQEARRRRVTNDLTGELPFDLYCPGAPRSDASSEGPYPLPLTNVVFGENLIAVELKQTSTNSTDITMGLWLVATITNFPVVVQPELVIERAVPGQVDLSWPEEGSAGFVLESRTSLSSGVNWMPVTETDYPSGGHHHVTVELWSGERFFRLARP